jgi:hypothetical protein
MIVITLQIERQLPGGSWTLHGDGRKFKDPDAAWQLLYEIMAWLPGTRLRLRAFRSDPYESTTKYLYPRSIP